MVKALVVFGFFLFGGLLVAIALFGMLGVWDKLLFVPLDALRQSWKWPVGLLAGGLASWFFASILMRTST